MMPRLADQAAAAYRNPNRAVLLDNLFRLRLVAGRYAEAAAALAEWRTATTARGDTSSRARALNTQYEIYLRAKQLERTRGTAFADALQQAFRDGFAKLDDRTAALVARAFSAIPPPVPDGPDGAQPGSDSTTTVPMADLVAWLRAYQVTTTYRELGRLAVPLIREDDRRRYDMTSDIQVRTPDGATVCALVWRPRTGPAKLPALLQFTIYADTTVLFGEQRRTAANGYAAVIGLHPRQALQPRPAGAVRARGRRRRGADRLDQPPALERRPGRHVRRQLLRDDALGRGEARSAGAQGHHGRRAGGAGAGRAHGRERRLELRVPVAVLHDRQQGAGRLHLQRPGALAPAEPGVVRERARLPRPGQDRRHAQPGLERMAGPPGVRRVLAGHDSVRPRVRPYRDSGAADGGLLLRRTGRRAPLLHRAREAQSARRALSGDRAVRSHPGAARRSQRAGRYGDELRRLRDRSRGEDRHRRRPPLPVVRLRAQGQAQAGAAGRQGELRGGGRERLEARAVDQRDGERRAAALSGRRAGSRTATGSPRTRRPAKRRSR